MKNISTKTNLLIRLILIAVTGIVSVGMAIGMSMTKYKAYRQTGITTSATVTDKSKEVDPHGDAKYPYKYYIHVLFTSESGADANVNARIKVPGSTWHDININSQQKIIYLPNSPSTVELERTVYGDMAMLVIFGVLTATIAGIGIFYRNGIAQKLESLFRKKTPDS